jgi:hypothetical protein
MPRSRVVLLSWVVAISLILAVILQFVDRLNLVATPPDISESASMVDRALATVDYRQAIWPVYLWTNLLFAIGLGALVVFVRAAVAAAGRRSLATFASLVTVGGIIGAVASLIPIGAVDSAVWVQYCDCGFKDTEIVSQQWAGAVAIDIGNWLLRVAAVTLGIGLIDLARSAGALLAPALRSWTYVTAIVLIVAPILAVIDRFGDVPDLLVGLATAVLVPVWAVWFGRSLAEEPQDVVPT